MVELNNNPQVNQVAEPKSRPVETSAAKTEDSGEQRHTDQDSIKEIHQAPPVAKQEEKQPGILTRFWNWIKSWFTKEPTKKAEPKKVAGQQIQVSRKAAPSQPFANVEIHEGLVTIDDMKELSQNYIVILGGNAQRQGGIFGQVSVLRPAQKLYPDSVVEMPVSTRAVTSYDVNEVKESAFRETNADEVRANLAFVEAALDEAINKAKQQGKTILVLKGGYGTGFSRMPSLSPLTFKGLLDLFQSKLGIDYQIDSMTGRYSLVKSAENEKPAVQPELKDRDVNLWEDPWVVMNHGKSAKAA